MGLGTSKVGPTIAVQTGAVDGQFITQCFLDVDASDGQERKYLSTTDVDHLAETSYRKQMAQNKLTPSSKAFGGKDSPVVSVSERMMERGKTRGAPCSRGRELP